VALSEDLRNELAGIAPKRGCDRLAELSGLFHGAGSAHLRGHGEVSVHLDLASSAVARRAFSLLRALGVESEIRTYRRHAFDRPTRYQLHVEGRTPALAVLTEAGVLGRRFAPLDRPPRRVVARACCRGAYLRGALLGGGSLSGPKSPHLELRTGSAEGADFLVWVAEEEGVMLKARDRGAYALAYAKGTESIADLLAAAGASDAVLAFEERAVMGATRARANRLANADHANLVRASRAAHRQLEAVRALERDGELERLPEPLREVARLRLRYPTLSLRELGARASPPASKASVYRRLSHVERKYYG
jgi:DNA-binding protein WhiA